ncbi:MAG: hypothetical protein HY883_02000 [Deltaproteobacteria bacterium]|nr:hypothetical protein [Deltaproteobacteria bacterium]
MHFLFLLFFLFGTSVHAQDFVIIVNPQGPLLKADIETARDIYLGETRFMGGMKLEPVNMLEGSVKDSFLEKVAGMSSKEYRLHWIKKVFQEGLSIPLSFATPQEAISFVKKEKGAIGYVPASGPSSFEGVVVIGP